MGNDWFDQQTGRDFYCVQDERHAIIGQQPKPHEGTSPRNLTCSTFGDELILATDGRARVFSVSMKDRGAILLGGHLGKAFWYSSSTGKFVTSTFYYGDYPKWVSAWNDANHAARYQGTYWTLLQDRSQYVYADRDDRPVERSYKELGRVFPHPLGNDEAKDFYATLRFTPMGDELTLDPWHAVCMKVRTGPLEAVRMRIPPREAEFVERAANYLEHPSFVVRFADLMGVPLEGVLKLAPQPMSQAVTAALRRALAFAIFTLPKQKLAADHFTSLEGRAWWTGYRHTAATAFTGGAGGLFGTLGLCIELPVTTCVMLRSMGAIAREYGEDLRQIDVSLECLSLFGTGGPSSADDEMDASYLAVRASISTLVKHAAKFVAHTPSAEVLTAIKNGTAPMLVKLIGKISERFEVAVSEKVMAQAIPLVGAFGGATLNVLFAEHFNAIARYHFGLRHLERRWGSEPIWTLYRDAAARSRSRKRWFESSAPDSAYRGDGPLLLAASKPR